MKRYFLLVTAVIATLFIASCSKVENPSALGVESEVTFSLQTPEIQTRTIGDGAGVNELMVAVYKDGQHLSSLDRTVSVSGGTAKVSLKLVNGINYKIVFWAYKKEGAPYTFDKTNHTLAVNYTGVVANNEGLDAFYLMKEYTPAGAATEVVTLRRPFAQLNIATTETDYNAAIDAGVNVTATSVTVKQVYTQMDMLTGAVSEPKDVTFNKADILSETLNVGSVACKWLSMNYLLVDEQEAVDVTMTTYDTNVGEKPFPNIPVKRNHRTIIYGDLLTSNIGFDVVIDGGFEEPNFIEYEDVLYTVVSNVDFANQAFEAGSKAVSITGITDDATITLPKTSEKVYLLLPGTEKSVTVNYANGATDAQKPTNIYINIPSGATVSTLNIVTPSSTVYVTGSVTTMNASTAANTLYLTNATVGSLTVNQGNVYVDGESTVSNVQRGTGNPDETTNLYVENGAEVTTVGEFINPIPNVSNEVTTFAQLQAAIANGCPTIYIKNHITNAEGITINTGKSLTIDFGGYTYTVSDPGAGSTGTQTQAFQLLKGQDITFRNGTIQCKDGATQIKMMIQNYCNLTLENMTIDGTKIAHNEGEIGYVVSNNSGNVEFRGNTSIKAIEDDYAFDVCKFLDYEAPVVTWNSTGEVEGFIELSGGEFIVNSNLALNAPIKATAEAKLTVNATITTVNNDNVWRGHNGLIVVKRGGNLTIDGSGTVHANTENVFGALQVTELNDNETKTATLTINGGTFKGYYYALMGNGTRHKTEVTINDGEFYTTENEGTAIFHPQEGTLTINGGKVKGYDAAVELRAGTLNINGGNFESTYSPTDADAIAIANGNGTSVKGATIAVSQHTTGKPIDVNINGGTFNCAENGAAFYEIYTNAGGIQNEDECSLSISGGTFNGPIFSDNFDNFIHGGTFSDGSAFEYLAPNANITLNSNVTVPANTVLPANVTIDGGNKEIVANGEASEGKDKRVLDFYGGTIKNLTFKSSNTQYDIVVRAGGSVIENCKFPTESVVPKDATTTYGKRAIYTLNEDLTGKLTVNNCEFDDKVYAFNFSTAKTQMDIAFNNCTLGGWLSGHGKSHTFTECTFKTSGNYQNYVPYCETTINGCTFSDNFTISVKHASTLTFDANCKVGATLLTVPTQLKWDDSGSGADNGTYETLKIGDETWTNIGLGTSESPANWTK